MIGGSPLIEASDRGASAVEYGLLIAAIAVAIVVAIFGLGTVIQAQYVESCNGLDATFNDPDVTCTP